jgi:DNA-binding transcriptional LysR family regulator
MLLTAKAEELEKPVREALLLIRTSITTPQAFDPKTTDRSFTIVCSDYVYAILVADCLRKASVLAPSASFDLEFPSTLATEAFERGEVDIMITLDTHMSDRHPKKRLFEDEFCCIADKRNPLVKKGLDLETYQEAPHVVVYFGPGHFPGFQDTILEQRKISRRIEVRVPTFSTVAESIVGTTRVATIQRRYAEYLKQTFPLAIMPVPFELPRIVESLQYHSIRATDAGLKWLMQCVYDEVALMPKILSPLRIGSSD